MNYELFPTEIIELQREIQNHPFLIEVLNELEADDWTMRLACIAAYCEIILDGVYNRTEILILCDTLTRRLKEKRVLVINTTEVGTITAVPSLDPPSPADDPEARKIILH